MSPVLLLFVALSIASAQFTWVGAGGTSLLGQDGDFSVATNWLLGVAPGATSDILITTVGSYTVDITQDYTTTGALSFFTTSATDVIQIHVHSGVTAVFGSLNIQQGIITVDAGAVFQVTGTVTTTVNAAISFAGTGQVIIAGDIDVAAGIAAQAQQKVTFTADLVLKSRLRIDDACQVSASGGSCDVANGGDIRFLSDNANFIITGAFDLGDCIPYSAAGVAGTLTFNPGATATNYVLSIQSAATSYDCHFALMGAAQVSTAASTTITGSVSIASDALFKVMHPVSVGGDATVSGEVETDSDVDVAGDVTFDSTSELSMKFAAVTGAPVVTTSGNVHFDGSFGVVQLGNFRVTADVEITFAVYGSFSGAFASVYSEVEVGTSSKRTDVSLMAFGKKMLLQSGGVGVHYNQDHASVYGNAAAQLVPSFAALLALVWASLRLA